jgi:hypothetical protein
VLVEVTEMSLWVADVCGTGRGNPTKAVITGHNEDKKLWVTPPRIAIIKIQREEARQNKASLDAKPGRKGRKLSKHK